MHAHVKKVLDGLREVKQPSGKTIADAIEALMQPPPPAEQPAGDDSSKE